MADPGIGARTSTEPRTGRRPYSAVMPWARRTTVVVAVLAALQVAAAVLFLAAAPSTFSWLTLGVALVVVPMTSGLSVLVARRPEGAVVGALLGLLSFAVAHVVAKEVWLQWLATTDRASDQAWLVAVTAENAWWILSTFGLLLLYFPDGRLPSRRWRSSRRRWWCARPSTRRTARSRRSRSAPPWPTWTGRSGRRPSGWRSPAMARSS